VLRLNWLRQLRLDRLRQLRLDRLGVLRLDRLRVLWLDRLGVLWLDRLRVLRLDRLRVLRLDRLRVLRLDRLGVLWLDRLLHLRMLLRRRRLAVRRRADLALRTGRGREHCRICLDDLDRRNGSDAGQHGAGEKDLPELAHDFPRRRRRIRAIRVAVKTYFKSNEPAC
jgi:hypothetical protein